MAKAKRTNGFGGVQQVADFFDLAIDEVNDKADAGEWPSYVIAGRRVFDVDELLRLLVRRGEAASCRS
ncbi:MAG: hypothetical protein IID45_09130 [Planctomycetes bacterium]|nr:hypothetical protein [Planctomycetota bacterium]